MKRREEGMPKKKKSYLEKEGGGIYKRKGKQRRFRGKEK